MSNKESKLGFIEASRQILTQSHDWSALKNPLSLFRVKKIAEISEPISKKLTPELTQFEIDAIPFATELDTGISDNMTLFDQSSNIESGPTSKFIPLKEDSLFSNQNSSLPKTPQEKIADALRGFKYDPLAKLNIGAEIEIQPQQANTVNNIIPFARKN
jgi:hypothetical protein